MADDLGNICEELFPSKLSTTFFVFPKKLFFSRLCKLVQPIRCSYTDQVT